MCIPSWISDNLMVFLLIGIAVGFVSALVFTYLWGLYGLLGLFIVVVFLMIMIAVNPNLVQYCTTGA